MYLCSMSDDEKIGEAKTASKTRVYFTTIISCLITVLMAIALYAQGRVLWCKSGDPAIYIGQAWNSSHTSQHLFDPYTFTHVLHGVLFFWIISAAFRSMDFSRQLTLAVAVEAAWELLENSNFIIEKYRENTASLDYFGDSVANSVGDVIACIVGFLIAFKLGRLWSLAFFIGVEIFLLLWIRDGLILNIIMLLHPIDGVKNWKMAI